MPVCPKCGCQIQDPFRGTVIIHDVSKCGGYKRNADNGPEKEKEKIWNQHSEHSA